MSSSAVAFISLGSNMGEREHYIQQALLEISMHPEMKIIATSETIFTEPLEVTNQPWFFNCITKIRTSLPPLDLLYSLQGMEEKIGRIRRFDKGPREIDLDILAYADTIMNSDDLQLPHHSLFSRPFIRQLLVAMDEENLYNYFKESGYEKYHQPL